MARSLLGGQLTARRASRVRFAVAGETEDAAIRRLLRENPTVGEISLSFEREPNYFLGTGIAGADDQTILAFEEDQLVCLGRCSIRQRYVNGALRRVGYLAELRLAAGARGRFDILRRGYEFFSELQRRDPPDFYFTSIATDNVRSIRFLERGLPGMPSYQHLTDFVTLLIPVPRRAQVLPRLTERAMQRMEAQGLRCVPCSGKAVADLVTCLNAHAQDHALAASWSESQVISLQRFGLPAGDFQLVLDGPRVIACAALWDQRSFRQTVIRGYARKLSLARPWINAAAPFVDGLRLPAVNSTLAHAFLSPLAVGAGEDELLIALIAAHLPLAAERGLEFLTLGFAVDDRRLTVVRRQFRCREYSSRLYTVEWREAGAATIVPDRQTLFPEVALL